MTDPTKTHIVIVIDRSGSMQGIRSDAQGAVNAFLKDQRKLTGPCNVTLVDFDAPRGNDEWLRTVYSGPMSKCPNYSLVPRGGTALLDAVAKTIVDVGDELAGMPERKRPGTVIFVVQTDGEENSSRDWKLDDLKQLIAQQTEKYGWEFIYLGMGPETYGEGQRMGFGNSTHAVGTSEAYLATYGTVSQHVASVRAGGQGISLNNDIDAAGNVTARVDDETTA